MNFDSYKLTSKIKEEPNDNDYEHSLNSPAINNPAKRLKLENQCQDELDLEWDKKDNYYGNSANIVDGASTIIRGNDKTSIENCLDSSEYGGIVTNESIAKKNDNETECPHCHNKLKNRETMLVHFRFCKEDIYYFCDNCTYHTQDKRELKYHIRNMHLITEESLIPLECLKCGQKYKSIDSVRAHVQSCGKKFSCESCSYKTEFKKMMIRHVLQLHIKDNGKSIKQKHLEATKMVNEMKNGEDRHIRRCPNCKETTKAMKKCYKCRIKLIHQCHKCGREFKSLTGIEYHLESKCNLKGFYYCPKCDYRSIYTYSVKRHMLRIHRGENLDHDLKNIKWKPKESEKDQSSLCKCSSCGKRFGRTTQLNKHVRFCQLSNRAARLANKDISVKNFHNSDISYSQEDFRSKVVRYCENCNKEKYLDDYHASAQQPCNKCGLKMKYKCKQCNQTRDRYHNIVYHFNAICDPKEEFQCSKCDYKSIHFGRINEHYNAMHNNLKNTCSKCGGQFKSSLGYRKHFQWCGQEAKFQCAHCSFKTKMKLSLKYHITRMHIEPSGKDHNLLIRNTKLRFLSVRQHVKLNCPNCKEQRKLSDRRKTCQQCKAGLQFKCNTCNETFTDDYEVACKHVKIYLEAVKYECRQCEKGMSSGRYLMSHMRTCSANSIVNSRTFRCTFCPHVSKYKSNIRSHERRMHPENL